MASVPSKSPVRLNFSALNVCPQSCSAGSQMPRGQGSIFSHGQGEHCIWDAKPWDHFISYMLQRRNYVSWGQDWQMEAKKSFDQCSSANNLLKTVQKCRSVFMTYSRNSMSMPWAQFPFFWRLLQWILGEEVMRMHGGCIIISYGNRQSNIFRRELSVLIWKESWHLRYTEIFVLIS